jgi:hypothetical protein
VPDATPPVPLLPAAPPPVPVAAPPVPLPPVPPPVWPPVPESLVLLQPTTASAGTQATSHNQDQETRNADLAVRMGPTLPHHHKARQSPDLKFGQ